MKFEELLCRILNFYDKSYDKYRYDKMIKEICDDENILSNLDLAALRCLIWAVQKRVQQIKKELS